MELAFLECRYFFRTEEVVASEERIKSFTSARRVFIARPCVAFIIVVVVVVVFETIFNLFAHIYTECDGLTAAAMAVVLSAFFLRLYAAFLDQSSNQ